MFVEVIDQISRDKKNTKAQVALVWVLSQNDDLVFIPATRKVHRLEENLDAFNVELSEIGVAIINNAMPSITFGNRY